MIFSAMAAAGWKAPKPRWRKLMVRSCGQCRNQVRDGASYFCVSPDLAGADNVGTGAGQIIGDRIYGRARRISTGRPTAPPSWCPLEFYDA